MFGAINEFRRKFCSAIAPMGERFWRRRTAKIAGTLPKILWRGIFRSVPLLEPEKLVCMVFWSALEPKKRKGNRLFKRFCEVLAVVERKLLDARRRLDTELCEYFAECGFVYAERG